MTDQPTDALEVLERMVGREPTRNEIADALGVHVSTISRRMTGGEGLRLEEVVILARYFQQSPCEVLVRMGVLTTGDVGRTAKIFIKPLTDIPVKDILIELMRRAEQDEDPPARGVRHDRRRGLFN